MSTTDKIRESLALAGISAAPEQVELLARDLCAVLEANRTTNLTAIRDPDAAVALHITDSLLGLPEVNEAPAGDLADLGAGAGFPGIPLGIMTGRHVVLVESVGKKSRLLAQLCQELGLDAEAVNVRAEEFAQDNAGRFAVVTARALSALPSLIELAAPLLQPGGRFVAYKGVPDTDEVDRGDRVASLVGLRRSESRTVNISDAGDAARTILVYERAGKAKIRLPRRTGLAQNQPLA